LHDPSSTTSPTPRVRVPWHLAWLVARLVTPLVVDYFAYVMRPGASARRAARHAARRTARCRLLRLRRATGCLGTSRGSSRGSSHGSLSTTSPTPRDRMPRHVARLVTRLVVDHFVVWTSLGPLPRWVPGPTTRWAPGTTRLALHGT
jgi:hypothetical protein